MNKDDVANNIDDEIIDNMDPDEETIDMNLDYLDDHPSDNDHQSNEYLSDGEYVTQSDIDFEEYTNNQDDQIETTNPVDEENNPFKFIETEEIMDVTGEIVEEDNNLGRCNGECDGNCHLINNNDASQSDNSFSSLPLHPATMIGPRISDGNMEYISRLYDSIIEGFENLGVYHCSICDEDLTRIDHDGINEIVVNINEEDVYSHVIEHYRNRNFNHFVCAICSERFENEYVYNLHLVNHIENGEYLEPMIQFADNDSDNDNNDDNNDDDNNDDDNNDDSDENGNDDIDDSDSYTYEEDTDGSHTCPFCQRRYDSEFLLGNHFIRRHGTYDELSDLADRKRMAFPGFENLIEWKMIEYMNKKTYDEAITKGLSNMCSICCIEYVVPESDEIKINSETDRNLCRPLMLNSCCSQMICTSCIANHLKRMGVLSCPYCRHNHTPDIDPNADNESDENDILDDQTEPFSNTFRNYLNSLNDVTIENIVCYT